MATQKSVDAVKLNAQVSVGSNGSSAGSTEEERAKVCVYV